MKPKIAIIGGGCSGLSFSSKIDTSLYNVTLFEKKNRLGSKILVAGKGGFNLTHSEPLELMLTRYKPETFLKPALNSFTNDDFRFYLAEIGIETYIGSSKRIFPIKSVKPVDILNAIENSIINNKVHIENKANWVGIELRNKKFHLNFIIDNIQKEFEFDIVVFALGGKSWKITGSDGKWTDQFKKLAIKTNPFQPSNCAVKVDWENELLKKIAGEPLKNISIVFDNKTLLGEVMLTKFGLEGTPIYALSSQIRGALNQNINPDIVIDFKPRSSKESLLKKISLNRTGSWSSHLKTQLKLTKTQLELIKSRTNKSEFQSAEFIVNLIKKFPIQIKGLAPIDEAISTVGGIALSEVSENFELLNCKNAFVLGEMLDWDAPTGGYLIQGCMSMGQHTAKYLNQLK